MFWRCEYLFFSFSSHLHQPSEHRLSKGFEVVVRNGVHTLQALPVFLAYHADAFIECDNVCKKLYPGVKVPPA